MARPRQPVRYLWPLSSWVAWQSWDSEFALQRERRSVTSRLALLGTERKLASVGRGTGAGASPRPPERACLSSGMVSPPESLHGLQQGPRAGMDTPAEANGWRLRPRVWEKRSLSVGSCSILLPERPSPGAGQGGVFGLLVSRFLCGGWSTGWESEMRGRPPQQV